jgi:hypothetical protein
MALVLNVCIVSFNVYKTEKKLKKLLKTINSNMSMDEVNKVQSATRKKITAKI